jgi:Tfp pilus assembly protein PilE
MDELRETSKQRSWRTYANEARRSQGMKATPCRDNSTEHHHSLQGKDAGNPDDKHPKLRTHHSGAERG